MGRVWEAERLWLRLRIGEPGQGSISATCNLGSHPVREFGGVREVIMSCMPGVYSPSIK